MDRAMLGIIKKQEEAADHSHEEMGDDGLLHCTVCHDPLECVIELPLGKRKVRCACRCVTEKRRKWENAQSELRRAGRRAECFRGTNMADWNFENDDRRNPELTAAMKNYADDFESYRRRGQGLLLYGNVGCGKTYYAACIANAVIDRGYRALMTNFAAISDELSGTWEKAEYIDGLMRYELLIIDDLGAERKSEYMQEIVWKIADARYRSGLPLIVTTNLTAEEIDKSGGIDNKRIYSRLLERCLAVEVKGRDRRREIAKRDWAQMRAGLGLGGV